MPSMGERMTAYESDVAASFSDARASVACALADENTGHRAVGVGLGSVQIFAGDEAFLRKVLSAQVLRFGLSLGRLGQDQ